MKTIKISKELKVRLNKLTIDNSSMDVIVNHLLDSVESDLENREVVDGSININLQEGTFNRLNALKKSNNDSYTKVLSDAVDLYNSKF